MPFDWGEYHHLAIDLKENPENFREACLRSSVSRTYYAVYHHVKIFVFHKYSKSFSNVPGSHGKIISCLKENNKFDIAKDFIKLKELREACDYEDEIDDIDRVVKDAFTTSEKLFRIIQNKK